MNIVFVLAHPDDESFGPAGTISKLAKDTNNTVIVVSLCNGNRPGADNVQTTRQAAFHSACQLLGAESIIFDSNDLYLEYHQAMSDVESVINKYKPEIVFTHNISDIHKDHKLTAEVVMAACRPKLGSTVNELYMCEIPASTYWSFGQMGDTFIPTTYKDITSEIEIKQKAMELYFTEIYNFPDARSVESMTTLAKYRGSQVGFNYAEAFKLIFSKN